MIFMFRDPFSKRSVQGRSGCFEDDVTHTGIVISAGSALAMVISSNTGLDDVLQDCGICQNWSKQQLQAQETTGADAMTTNRKYTMNDNDPNESKQETINKGTP